MRAIFRWVSLFSLFFIFSCQATRQSTQNATVDEKGVLDITIPTMTKDAVRLKGEIVKVNGAVNKRNSYDLRVAEVIKYGATFSSAEPKVGEIVNLVTPAEVSFENGQVIIIDVLTPRFGRETEPMRVRLGEP